MTEIAEPACERHRDDFRIGIRRAEHFPRMFEPDVLCEMHGRIAAMKFERFENASRARVRNGGKRVN